MNAGASLPHLKEISHPVIVRFAGDLLTVISPDALPPGSRVKLAVSPEADTPSLHLTGKVIKVNPAPNARFELTVRLHSVTRDQASALSRVTA